MVFISLYCRNINWLVVRKKNHHKKIQNVDFNFDIKEFDDLLTYLVIAIIVGGRLGYIIFL